MQAEARKEAMDAAIKWMNLRFAEYVESGQQSEILATVEFRATIHLMAQELGASCELASAWADVAEQHLANWIHAEE